MITARYSPLFDRIFRLYNRRLLKRHFAAVRVAGLEHARALDRRLPVICFGNHSCWWDGLIEYYLARELLDVQPLLMMEERQLQRYRFFRYIGAFSVNRDSAREAYASVQYAARMCHRPGAWLWIYPQGMMRPNDARPLCFERGAALAASLIGTTVQLLPFAHRYEFLAEQRPEAFTLFGKPLIVDQSINTRVLTQQMENAAAELLETLRLQIASGQTQLYPVTLSGALSTNVRYDRLRGKV
jgi:1-acyl-sn-glycerol-3-phosphate acyltransferase